MVLVSGDDDDDDGEDDAIVIVMVVMALAKKYWQGFDKETLCYTQNKLIEVLKVLKEWKYLRDFII